MSDTLLSIQNVRVQYGRFVAVDEFTCDLHAGDLLGLIGPNGAGKTTTLRTAAGLQPIARGAIRIFGHDVFGDATLVNHHLGFTPDTPTLYDTLTVEKFLQFIGRCYKLDAQLTSERIDHWLDALWLSEKKDERVGALLRGMRQRLAVARTLLPDPDVVLLDEPAAGLDPAGRVEFRKLLASLRDQGKAIIVSSHILADLVDYCTHIGIMGHGRMLKFGTVAQITSDHTHDRINYRLVLVQAIGDLATRFKALPAYADLHRLKLDRLEVTFEYDSEKQAGTALLRSLLDAGLPVAEFHTIRPDLEQAYLRAGIGQVD